MMLAIRCYDQFTGHQKTPPKLHSGGDQPERPVDAVAQAASAGAAEHNSRT